MKRILMTMAACLALAACDDVSGTYSGNENSFLEKLEFKSDKVDVTGLGETTQGTYEVAGEKVMITIAGETQVFTRGDDGCLDGGLVLGKYCKE